MRRIFVSGLVNVETTVRVRQFPIPYYPIDYPFFGIDSDVSGVAYNIAKALVGLGDEVTLASMVADDFHGAYIRQKLRDGGIDPAHVRPILGQSASSVVLYDAEGRRQIYCDLKDVQETTCDFPKELWENADLIAACNINFNRPLLHMAKQAGKTVATDVHVLGDIFDGYNREFLECADIVFLSDEAIGENYRPFLRELAAHYPMQIIVLGRGSKGAALYRRQTGDILEFPAVSVGKAVNTVGAGDALFSAFIHCYACGKTPVEALTYARIFAARKITVSGASRGFADEVQMEELLKKYNEGGA